MDISLRRTIVEDLKYLYRFQLDDVANSMAAFIPKNYKDWDTFNIKWSEILSDDSFLMHTIIVDDKVVGSVVQFEMFDEINVSYWIDRKYWGKGVATKALALFLEITKIRPLFAAAAFDNIGSQRVLIKNGFKFEAKEKGFAVARGEEIVEYIYKLD